MGKLNIDLKVGETLHIGEATVQLEKKTGQAARLKVTADSSIKINHQRKSASEIPSENSAHG